MGIRRVLSVVFCTGALGALSAVGFAGHCLQAAEGEAQQGQLALHLDLQQLQNFYRQLPDRVGGGIRIYRGFRAIFSCTG